MAIILIKKYLFMLLPYKPIRSILHNSISDGLGLRSECTAFEKKQGINLVFAKINFERHHYSSISLIGKAEVTNVVESVLKDSSCNPYKHSHAKALALADSRRKTLVWLSSISCCKRESWVLQNLLRSMEGWSMPGSSDCTSSCSAESCNGVDKISANKDSSSFSKSVV